MYLIQFPHKILFSKQYRPTFSNLSEYIRPLSPCSILDGLSFASFHFYDTFITKRKLRPIILLQIYDLILFLYYFLWFRSYFVSLFSFLNYVLISIFSITSTAA